MIGVLVFLLLVVAIWGYIVVFRKAMSHEITVYSGWTDFAWASSWIYSIFAWLIFWEWAGITRNGSALLYLLAVVSLGAGLISVFKLISGAFKGNDSIVGALWSLLGRFLASIFAFVIIVKIIGEEGEDSKGRQNILLMFLRIALYGYIFKKCVAPLVCDNRGVEIIRTDGVLQKFSKVVYAVYIACVIVIIFPVIFFTTTSKGSEFDSEGSKAVAISCVRAFIDNEIEKVVDLSCEDAKYFIAEFDSSLDKTEMREKFFEHMRSKIGSLKIDESSTTSEAWLNPRAEDWANARDVKQADVRVCLVDSSNNYYTVRCHLKRGWLSWKLSWMDKDNPIVKAFNDFERITQETQDCEPPTNRNYQGRNWPKILGLFVVGCFMWYSVIRKLRTSKMRSKN